MDEPKWSFRTQMPNQQGSEFYEVIVRAWMDEDYKKRLLSSSKAALQELNIRFDEDVEICVLEETPRKRYLVIPSVAAVRVGAVRRETESPDLC